MRCSRRVTSRISCWRRNWGHWPTPWRRKKPNSMRSCLPPTLIPRHSLLSPGNWRYCKICREMFFHVLNYKPFFAKLIKLSKTFSLLDLVIYSMFLNTSFYDFLFAWNKILFRRMICILILFLGCP